MCGQSTPFSPAALRSRRGVYHGHVVGEKAIKDYPSFNGA